MEIIVLNQSDMEDVRRIVDNRLTSNSKEEVVFVADLDAVSMTENEKFLWKYIEELYLSVEKQLKIKICQELKNLDVLVKYPGESEESKEIHEFSELLKVLDMENGTLVIVRGDKNVYGDDAKIAEVKAQVSDIVQQLIYLNFPLTKIQVMSEKEAENIDKIHAFEENVQEYAEKIEESIKELQQVSDDEFGYKSKILENVNKIQDYLKEASKNELSIAVAACKKSGKSVVVDGFIEQEIAPSGLILPTPNCCIYRKIDDKNYQMDYNGEHLEFDTQREIREYIEAEFKKARTDDEHSRKIPDMYIGYPNNHSGFMQYVIYDTPGPDIGQSEHSKAQHERMDVIEKADVIIFTIDYTKYLTQPEVKYLKDVKEIFAEKGKEYSLILNVNKLDLRYNSDDDQKNTVWILDYIKQRLIKIIPEYRSCIVTGTSANTYFNAIAAPLIHADGHEDCSILSDSGDFKNDFEDLLDDYAGTEKMSVLSQLDEMMGVSRKFHRKRLNSLEEIKEFSGMPNMLEYVRYVTINKARVEKLNSLMYKIEQCKNIIHNLFVFKQLEEDLRKNTAELYRARTILSTFKGTVSAIYNEDNSDLHQRRKYHPEEFKSSILSEIAQKDPVAFEDLIKEFKNMIEGDFHFHDDLEEYTNSILKARIQSQIRKLFASSTKKRGGKTVVSISKVADIYREMIDGEKIAGDIELNLKTKGEQYVGRFITQSEQMAADLTTLLISRKDKLVEATRICKEKLKSECDIPFNMEIATFPPVVMNKEILKDISFKIAKQAMDKVVKDNAIDKYAAAKGETFLQKVADWIHKNNEYIFLEDALSIYEKEHYGMYIRTLISEASEAKKAYVKVKEILEELAEKIVKNITEEMHTACLMAIDAQSVIEEALDLTGDLDANILKLEKQKKQLAVLEKCVASFIMSWTGKGDGDNG